MQLTARLIQNNIWNIQLYTSYEFVFVCLTWNQRPQCVHHIMSRWSTSDEWRSFFFVLLQMIWTRELTLFRKRFEATRDVFSIKNVFFVEIVHLVLQVYDVVIINAGMVMATSTSNAERPACMLLPRRLQYRQTYISMPKMRKYTNFRCFCF